MNEGARISLAALIACACGALAACSTSNLRRDMDVSGSLPRAIGLGAFTPACVFLCFPSASFTQGDVVREDIDPEAFKVHSVTVQEKTKGGGKPRKPAPPPNNRKD